MNGSRIQKEERKGNNKLTCRDKNGRGKKGEREGRNENGLKEVVEKRKEGSKRREEGRGGGKEGNRG